MQFLVPLLDVRPAEGGRPSASRIYRNAIAKDKMPTLEATTLHELFEGSVRQHGNEKCLGWRPVNAETGKAADHLWMTYFEAAAKVKCIASGLAGLGLTKGHRVSIYGVNCPEWMIAMQVRP
eukprot:GHUV01053071.1.p1 GENE.GHUV01053071.1~~GHUV01053071.1.p1  ORF type:complete len:122 (-),score=17.60 GHUV01053071.1:141-506(-)